MVVNDWSLSGIWNGATGAYYAVSFSYQTGGGNVNLTGSPDFAPRVVLVPDADLGGGCNNEDLLKQFNTTAFRGPAVNSDGLESGNGYLKGCFISSLDLAIARTFSWVVEASFSCDSMCSTRSIRVGSPAATRR